VATDIVYFGLTEHNRYSADAEEVITPLIKNAENVFNKLDIHGVANDWLIKMPWKRSLGLMIYGDLLAHSERPLSVVEIGGSLSGLTLALLERHDYTLVEKVTHEAPEDYRKVEAIAGKKFCFLDDWNNYSIGKDIDLVVASDIFPNVDQRAYEFFDKFLPHTKEMRVTLTFYENVFFEVKRISSGEVLIMKPWGVREILSLLQYIEERHPFFWCGVTVETLRSEIHYEDLQGKLFTNKRNIVLLKLKRS